MGGGYGYDIGMSDRRVVELERKHAKQLEELIRSHDAYTMVLNRRIHELEQTVLRLQAIVNKAPKPSAPTKDIARLTKDVAPKPSAPDADADAKAATVEASSSTQPVGNKPVVSAYASSAMTELRD